MVQAIELHLTKRQGDIVEEALRHHLNYLNVCSVEAHNKGDRVGALEIESTANVLRNTLAQVKTELYSLIK